MAADSELKIERLPLAGTLTDRVCDALIELISGDDFPGGIAPAIGDENGQSLRRQAAP